MTVLAGVGELGLDFLGTSVGFVGVMLAVTLRMVSRKYCPPSYALGFLVFGISMILLHSEPFVSPSKTVVLAVVAYTALLALELGVAYWIYKTYPVENSLRAPELLFDG